MDGSSRSKSAGDQDKYEKGGLLASSAVDRHSPVDDTLRLVGWRWGTVLIVLAVGALLDVLLTAGSGSRAWPGVLVLLVAVPFGAVRGLRTGGRRLFTAAGLMSGLSLAGSVGWGIASVIDHRWAAADFGLAEGAALTLILVACYRRAAGRQRIVTALVALAVLTLPLRLGWSPDVVPILLAAFAVSALAAATGSALRATDVSHRSAVSATRRAEREEMARELHDVVAHHVTGMVVLTQAARAIVDEPAVAQRRTSPVRGALADPRLDDALATVERAGAEALTSLRSMVAVLRSSDLDGGEAPLEPTLSGADLAEVVRRFRASGAAVHVDYTVAPFARLLPAPVQAAVHRVAQESLTNVSRYARGAEWVRVEIARTRTHTVVTVSDSGGHGEEVVGSDWAGSSGGFGIVGMRERVSVLGGSLEAGPTPGGGWTVRAQVPM